MTGLPQGVTLPGAPTASTVVRDRRVLGYVALQWAGGWHAWSGGAESHRTFRTRDAAVRWVCLQARPVVYQVRRCRDYPHLFPEQARWTVTGPNGQTVTCDHDHDRAVRMATNLARQRAALR